MRSFTRPAKAQDPSSSGSERPRQPAGPTSIWVLAEPPRRSSEWGMLIVLHPCHKTTCLVMDEAVNHTKPGTLQMSARLAVCGAATRRLQPSRVPPPAGRASDAPLAVAPAAAPSKRMVYRQGAVRGPHPAPGPGTTYKSAVAVAKCAAHDNPLACAPGVRCMQRFPGAAVDRGGRAARLAQCVLACSKDFAGPRGGGVGGREKGHLFRV